MSAVLLRPPLQCGIKKKANFQQIDCIPLAQQIDCVPRHGRFTLLLQLRYDQQRLLPWLMFGLTMRIFCVIVLAIIITVLFVSVLLIFLAIPGAIFFW